MSHPPLFQYCKDWRPGSWLSVPPILAAAVLSGWYAISVNPVPAFGLAMIFWRGAYILLALMFVREAICNIIGKRGFELISAHAVVMWKRGAFLQRKETVYPVSPGATAEIFEDTVSGFAAPIRIWHVRLKQNGRELDLGIVQKNDAARVKQELQAVLPEPRGM